MKLARTLIPLTVGALLLSSTAAFARDRDNLRRHHDRHERHYNVPPAPPIDSHRHGRYELRTVSRWVEGRWVDEWVPGRCVTKEKRRRTVTKCREGRYERRWIPGHHAQVQDWVWVPHRTGRFSVTMRF
jgi:hypothetical protein